jgi:hypothetical protein
MKVSVSILLTLTSLLVGCASLDSTGLSTPYEASGDRSSTIEEITALINSGGSTITKVHSQDFPNLGRGSGLTERWTYVSKSNAKAVSSNQLDVSINTQSTSVKTHIFDGVHQTPTHRNFLHSENFTVAFDQIEGVQVTSNFQSTLDSNKGAIRRGSMIVLPPNPSLPPASQVKSAFEFPKDAWLVVIKTRVPTMVRTNDNTHKSQTLTVATFENRQDAERLAGLLKSF